MIVDQNRLAKIGVELGQQISRIAQEFFNFTQTGSPSPDLIDLFVKVEALAREGIDELSKGASTH